MYKKIFAIISVAAMWSSFITSSKNSNPDWLYSCDSHNMLGLMGYYYDDGNLYLVFDGDQINGDGPITSGLEYIWEVREWPSTNPIYVYIGPEDGEAYQIEPETINVNVTKNKLFISFEIDEDEADDILGFTMYAEEHFSFIREDETIRAEFWGGECVNYLTQVYDPDEGQWSDIEYEEVLYPMTDG